MKKRTWMIGLLLIAAISAAMWFYAKNTPSTKKLNSSFENEEGNHPRSFEYDDSEAEPDGRLDQARPETYDNGFQNSPTQDSAPPPPLPPGHDVQVDPVEEGYYQPDYQPPEDFQEDYQPPPPPPPEDEVIEYHEYQDSDGDYEN